MLLGTLVDLSILLVDAFASFVGATDSFVMVAVTEADVGKDRSGMLAFVAGWVGSGGV